ncbi:MAG: hypothetical protein LBH52_00220 [Puniceicoccales bacterium]|jgi:hypothetical protein|nr:hypothetical protein [Puniceicoccales bacterium]
MKQNLIKRWIHVGIFMVGMGSGNDISGRPSPTGPCLGYLFEGTPFFKDGQGGFCTASGQRVRNVASSWLQEFRFNVGGRAITVYCGSHNEVLDEHNAQLPIIGYHRVTKQPIFLHWASDMCIFGDPWPDQMQTRTALAPHVIFTDRLGPIELPVHPTLGQAVGHMRVMRGQCVPIFCSPEGRFMTENGCAVVNVNGTYMRVLIPGRLLLELSTFRLYNGHGHGPLPDQYAGTIGEDHTLYKGNGVFYAFVENRVEIYGVDAQTNRWTLINCELFY